TGDSLVTTGDVIAIQRFVLTMTSGTGNTGQYQFNPVNRGYTGVVTDQTGQDYDALVFGDVAGGFVYRPGDGNEWGSGEIAAAVAAVTLPDISSAESKSNFVGAVRASEIDPKNKL